MQLPHRFERGPIMNEATAIPDVPAFSGGTLAPAGTTPVAVRWTPLGRFGFRFAFCYLLIYAFGCCGTLDLLPLIGRYITSGLSLAPLKPAVWLVQHRFHVTGVAAHLHPTGSGDTLIDWVALGVMLVYALAAALLWTAIDRRRLEYQTAAAWLRFILRLTLVFALASFGFVKLFPLQMAPPSLAVLNEPLGNTSPNTLLWTLIALHPGYEMICGAAEVAAAVLLFFRRTALTGALLAGFVTTNVLLFNVFFDVPVKIHAAHLLLFSIAITVPDLQALFDFFWRRKPAAPTGIWVPPTERRRFRIATLVVELMLLAHCLPFVLMSYRRDVRQRANLRHPSPLSGQWHVDSAPLTADGQTTPKSIPTGEGLPVIDIFLEPSGHVMLRDSSGVLWRADFEVDDKKHTLHLSQEDHSILYNLAAPDPAHLVLTPTGKHASTDGTLHLSRIPLPNHYPLLDRGFHLINEWGLERWHERTQKDTALGWVRAQIYQLIR